jgi:hypothetical protein
VLSEDGPNALVTNHTSEALTITYVRNPPTIPEMAFDTPLDAGAVNTLMRPFRTEGSDLVDGCLPGPLIASTADGREVATITELCDGERWDIQN